MLCTVMTRAGDSVAKELSSPLGRVLVNEELIMSSDSNVSSAFGKCWLNSGPEENYSH